MKIRRSSSENASECTVFASAPAKVNLFLEILGKRPDGYHEIETLMLAVDLQDELEFTRNESGILTLECDHPELSVGPENLILRAARLLREKTGCSLGASIRLTKRIPWAAGLGGGSSDAAATLAGLAELWQLDLSTDQLVSMGSELGSDVPFFFHTPVAWARGRGERVEPVEFGQPLDLVLVKPTVGLNTAAVYREFAKSPASGPPQNGLAIHRALAEGNLEELGRTLHNRLQDAAFGLESSVEMWYRRLRNTGAMGCLMSGSGSCLFAVCRNRREAEQVVRDLFSGSLPDAQGYIDSDSAGIRIFIVRSSI